MRVQNISNGYVNSSKQSNTQAPAFKQHIGQVLVSAAKGVDIFLPLDAKLANAARSSLLIEGKAINPGHSFFLKEGKNPPVERIFKGAYESVTDLGDRGVLTNRIIHADINGGDLKELTTQVDETTQTQLLTNA